jgi:glycosyltransferase involved in cell wall biosynthesis
MRYSIIDIDVAQSLPKITISEADLGIAVLLRRKGKPIDFWMETVPACSVLTTSDLAQRISKKAKVKLLSESIREELTSFAKRPSFPSLTVAICTKDRPNCLSRCLQSLLELKDRASGPESEFDILVIDNASSDDQTKRLVKQFSDIRYLSEIKPGLNFARNRALRETDCELVAYIDDDVVVDRGWLHGLQEAWSENPDAAAFTGQVLPMELETEAQILFEQRGGFRRGFEKICYASAVPLDDGFLYPCRTGIFGVGCNMAFRRQVLLEIGGFDEALDTGPPLPGGGDHDIFYQIIRAGYPLVYEPAYLVFHQHRRTMKKLSHQYWTWGLSVMTFASKAHGMDRPLRSRWRKLIVGWLREHLKELTMAMFGRHVLPTRFLFWELCGGIIGLCGEYERSKKRVQQIRKLHQ